MKFELAPILRLLIEAGKTVMKFYDNKDFSIDTKSDESPVTSADKRSNELIFTGLTGLFPEIPIISEESINTPWEVRKNWELCWMVDPLDGTKEFIKGNGEFSINLALIEKHEPILGLVYFPVQRWMYYAVKNNGAYKIEYPDPNDPKNLEVGCNRQKAVRLPIPGNRHSTSRIMISRSHAGKKEHDFVEKVKGLGYPVETLPHGSAMKHCLIAEGKGDIYPKFGICHEWDTAPGQLILQEAGGRLTQTTNWKPLQYNKSDFINPEFIMWGPSVSKNMEQSIRDARTSQ